MPRLVHVSDLHFGPVFRPAVGEALLRAIESLESDALVVAGDLTQRAKRGQFAAARAFLDRLPAIPRVVVPGNHDIPLYRFLERLALPRYNYGRAISADYDQVLAIPGAVIVALDTTSPRGAIVNGWIRERQLELCERELSGRPPGTARIVVAHHPLAPPPDGLGEAILPRARRIVERLVSLGVEMVLGGHLHRAFVADSRDAYPGIPDDHGLLMVHSGTATSSRGRGAEAGGNSFNVVDVGELESTVTHYDYDPGSDAFVPRPALTFPRRRA